MTTKSKFTSIVCSSSIVLIANLAYYTHSPTSSISRPPFLSLILHLSHHQLRRALRDDRLHTPSFKGHLHHQQPHHQIHAHPSAYSHYQHHPTTTTIPQSSLGSSTNPHLSHQNQQTFTVSPGFFVVGTGGGPPPPPASFHIGVSGTITTAGNGPRSGPGPGPCQRRPSQQQQQLNQHQQQQSPFIDSYYTNQIPSGPSPFPMQAGTLPRPRRIGCSISPGQMSNSGQHQPQPQQGYSNTACRSTIHRGSMPLLDSIPPPPPPPAVLSPRSRQPMPPIMGYPNRTPRKRP